MKFSCLHSTKIAWKCTNQMKKFEKETIRNVWCSYVFEWCIFTHILEWSCEMNLMRNQKWADEVHEATGWARKFCIIFDLYFFQFLAFSSCICCNPKAQVFFKSLANNENCKNMLNVASIIELIHIIIKKNKKQKVI